MQTKKQFRRFIALIFIGFVISCNNVYNNLIPNDEQNILEFSLSSEDHKTRSVSSEISENYITVKVPKGTDITKLFPKATLPKHATLFPLTLKYLQEAFPHTDVLDMALRINPAKKGLENWFLALYEENPDFSIPPLVFPINFFYPVTFAVIGGQGGVEIYKVKVIYDDGSEPDVGDLPDPNSDESKKILSFYVPDKQKGSSTITHNTIDFTLKAGTDLRCLLPEITTEPDAVAIPLTKEYLFEVSAKLGLDPLSFAQGYMDAPDKRTFIKGAIATSDTSNLSLAIDKIIDFTNPIQIVVLGKLNKSVRLYTATATLDSDDAYLKTLAFTKAKNPQLIKDYIADVFQEQKEISCTLYYPVEYYGRERFLLTPDVQYTGTSITIEYNNSKYDLNGEDERRIRFAPIKTSNESYYLGRVTAKLHIDNGDVRKTYTLKLIFKEDPDTIRSITDFRFNKRNNKRIKATAIASIVNRDDVGEIKATVLYSGELPNVLIPSIVTGGAKILVGGKNQLDGYYSGYKQQDFSAPIEYVCVSKDGNYERVYTVTVEFIKVETPEVVLKSFKFPLHLNKEISQDAIGVIDEAHSVVNVEVVYDGTKEPLDLVSEFSATGRVSIEGITQTSGFSTQNYKYDVYLKVTALDDENVSKTYRVHVTFNYSTQNKCQLLRFYLEGRENPTLNENVEGYISTSSYNVYVLVPKACDITLLVPSFEAEGIVKVADAVQTSGSSIQDFTNIVEYVVVSENGQNSKTYKVKVQKQGDIIYLDPHARGKNNGSTWKDAFTKLEDAIEAANDASENSEIWATGGEFYNIETRLRKAIIIRGGFKGGETSKDEREKNKYHTNFCKVKFGVYFEGALVFDNIYFSGDGRLFGNYYYNYPEFYGDFRKNSITFENCHVKDADVGFQFPNFQKLKIKDSYFEKTAKVRVGFSFPYDMDKKSFSSLGLEMEIENSNFLCDVDLNYGLDDIGKPCVLNLFKLKDSKLSSGFRMMAENVEFENVNEEAPQTKIWLYNVRGNATFNNVEISEVFIDCEYFVEYGKISFNRCRVSNIIFNENGRYHLEENKYGVLESLELINCGGINNVIFYNKEDNVVLFDNLTMKDCSVKNANIEFDAKNIYMKGLNIKDNIKIKGNSKVTLEDVRANSDGGRYNAVIDCRAKEILVTDVWNSKELLLYGKENVVLEKSSFRNNFDRLTLIGNNVRMKDTYIDRNNTALVNIIALENFEFDVDKEASYTTALYYPKAYNVQDKRFGNLKLLKNFEYDDSLKFPDVSGAFTFTNCTFFKNFECEREGTVIDSCEFIGDNKVFNTGSIKIENIEKKLGTLEIDTLYKRTITISNSHFERTSFGASRNRDYGHIIIKSSSFKNIEKFSQGYLTFDISNSTFEIDGAVLDTDVWFHAYKVDIKNSTFEKKYPYQTHAKARILLDVSVGLKLKNTRFINTKDMCDVCIRVDRWENEVYIDGGAFIDSGCIYICRYKNLLVKDSTIHGVMLDLVVLSDGKDNNYSSSSQTLFENCDFFNADKPSTMMLSNYISKGIGGVDYVSWGPVAVKFEYDMRKIPSNLRNKIGTPTPQKIAEVLKPFITGCKERVGYFINLGNRNPSNSSPAKFLGNYY